MKKKLKKILKVFLKIIAVILCLILVFACFSAIANKGYNKKMIEYAASFEPVSIENQLIPAVSRMMEPLGYDKDRLRELSSNERQQSLDAFF